MADVIERLNAALEGRYRILEQRGEGGMATVYVADDLRHDRKVAIKVLRPELAAVVGGERFLTEIKTTANLQHPHILPLHDSGEADGFLFYVMPFVEGESLAEKLAREKQLRVDDALALTRKVADALDYAHEHGVVHRDVKPANILLSERGEPLVADFGIALAVSQAGGGRITETGLSLGTPHYMSPEQATGDRDVDPRSDVYALGCVLYEMLAGQPPFAAPTAQAVLARILTEPPRRVTELRRTVPPHVAAAITRALEKLPADRFVSAAEFAAALDDPGFTYEAPAAPAATAAHAAVAPPAAPRRGALVPALAIGLVAALAAAAFGWLRSPPAAPEGVTTRARITGLDMQVRGSGNFGGRRLAISPDGRRIVAGGRQSEEGGVVVLFVREAGALEWRELPNTAGGTSPTFNPSGEWIAFQARGAIWKVPVSGGPALPVAEAGGSPHWGANDVIVFEEEGALYGVPGSGGAEPELLLDDPDLRPGWPHMLPDGSGVLFSTSTGRGGGFANRDPLNGRILHLDLGSGEVTELVASGNGPVYVPTGHIVYGHGGQALMAVTFDPKTREVGSPTTILPALTVYSGGGAQFAVSATGTLLYNARPDTPGGGSRRLVEIGVDGSEAPLDLSPSDFAAPRYSPDGRRIAYQDAGEIRVYDVVTGASPQLTDGGGIYPVWSPGGEYLYFTASRAGGMSLDGFRRRADGSEPAERLFARPGPNYVGAVSAGDSLLIVRENTGDRGRDLLLLRMGPGGAVPDSAAFEPLLTAEWDESRAEISPDGRYIAYVSDQEGEPRVYVQTFPVPSGRRSISPGRGTDPGWAPNGGTLYYVDGATLQAVDITTAPSFSVGPPRPVLTYPIYSGGGAQPVPHWDVHPDGARFVVVRAADANDLENQPPGFVLQDVYIATSWFTELRALMGERN